MSTPSIIAKASLGRIIRQGEVIRKLSALAGGAKVDQRSKEWAKCYAIVTEQYVAFYYSKEKVRAVANFLQR